MALKRRYRTEPVLYALRAGLWTITPLFVHIAGDGLLQACAARGLSESGDAPGAKIHGGVMPFVRFQIDADEPPNVVLERLRASVRPKPELFESFVQGFRRTDPSGPPFVGSVIEGTFKMHRDFRGRNSFVPLIRGRIISTDNGTSVRGIMFLHPLVAAFMVFWLGATGYAALNDKSAAVGAGLMFLFGLSLMLGCFFFEVSRAKQLLKEAVQGSLVENGGR